MQPYVPYALLERRRKSRSVRRTGGDMAELSLVAERATGSDSIGAAVLRAAEVDAHRYDERDSALRMASDGVVAPRVGVRQERVVVGGQWRASLK